MSTEELPVQQAVAARVRMGRPLSRRSDAALVRAAQQGDAEAVDELFRRHWPSVHRSAWLVVHDPAAAEDIAQEAFVSALRALDRFDRRRPLAPWLHRIVVNRAIDWARRTQARSSRPEPAIRRLYERLRARGPSRQVRPPTGVRSLRAGERASQANEGQGKTLERSAEWRRTIAGPAGSDLPDYCW